MRERPEPDEVLASRTGELMADGERAPSQPGLMSISRVREVLRLGADGFAD